MALTEVNLVLKGVSLKRVNSCEGYVSHQVIAGSLQRIEQVIAVARSRVDGPSYGFGLPQVVRSLHNGVESVFNSEIGLHIS